MAGLVPCSHREFIRKLRALGFHGPYSGGRHQFMTKNGGATIRVPNPHAGDIGINLLSYILRVARIDQNDWTNA